MKLFSHSEMKPLYTGLVLPAFLLSLFSCKNHEAALLSFSLPGQEALIEINSDSLTVGVKFPDQTVSASDLCVEFLLSEGARAYVNQVAQISGVSRNDFETPFTFTVISENDDFETEWKISSSNNDYSLSWGLGGFIKEERALNRPYEWYIDQSLTGAYGDWNCAPSCIAMAMHWQDENFSATVEDLRTMMGLYHRGWYLSEIDSCLERLGAMHEILELSDYRKETTGMLLDELKRGNLLLMAIDIYYLRENENPQERTGRYYDVIELGTGHCILLKGYKTVDGKVYFEAYDPIGYDYTYDNGSYKGKDRYYSSDEIYTAAFASWKCAFVIPGSPIKEDLRKRIRQQEFPDFLIL
ncbi:MAG: hypothetical protein ACOYXB_11145 [Bacteroidota bacterium]